jgi:hypothetical protein
MTAKKKAAKPRTRDPDPEFHNDERVIYNGWDQLAEVHNAPAIVVGLDSSCMDGETGEVTRMYGRRYPKRLAWWYHVRLIGDKYSRYACEDELTRPPSPKFEPGNLVDFDIQNPTRDKAKGSGIVVEVHQDTNTYAYAYDIWVKSGDSAASASRNLKTPFRVPEGCLSLTKKTKKDKGA